MDPVHTAAPRTQNEVLLNLSTVVILLGHYGHYGLHALTCYAL